MSTFKFVTILISNCEIHIVIYILILSRYIKEKTNQKLKCCVLFEAYSYPSTTYIFQILEKFVSYSNINKLSVISINFGYLKEISCKLKKKLCEVYDNFQEMFGKFLWMYRQDTFFRTTPLKATIRPPRIVTNPLYIWDITYIIYLPGIYWLWINEFVHKYFSYVPAIIMFFGTKI